MIYWNKPTKVVWYIATRQPLSEKELLGALRVSSENTLWIAILQLIDGEIRDANEAAQVSVGNYGICASEVGGVQHLERLRNTLLEKRAQAIAQVAPAKE